MSATITAYSIGVFIHVVAVVVAFGPAFVYPVFASAAESWISVGFLAIIVLFAMNHAFLLPRNREALAALERDLDEGGELSDEYLQHMAKIRTGGLVASLIVVITIFFMVVKP